MTSPSAVPLPAAPAESPASTGGHPTRGGRRFPLDWLGLVPFMVMVGLFLLLPTGVIAVSAFLDGGNHFTLANLAQLGLPRIALTFRNSLQLSVISAAISAPIGALLAYAVSVGNPDGLLRRVTSSLAGVFAQAGGVPLALGFIATYSGEGLLTLLFAQIGLKPFGDASWLYTVSGLILVYTYFQVPLMFLIFMPAIDGLRPQWREAVVNLGGSTWEYWRHVGFPVLRAPFLGALLVLFANSFSAYATAAVLVTQGNPIAPLQIRNTFTSEVVFGTANVGKALALVMIVIVAIVMTLNSIIQKRVSRWSQ